MRAIGAALLVIAILALGFVALSFQADAVRDDAVTNGTNASATAYNITNQVQENVGGTIVNVLIYGGFAAGALVAVGIIVAYGPRGYGGGR